MKNETREESEEYFCHNVRWLREHHRLSQTGMAAMLRISVAELEQIEGGSIPEELSIDVLCDIYRYFGVSLSDQMGRILGQEE